MHAVICQCSVCCNPNSCDISNLQSDSLPCLVPSALYFPLSCHISSCLLFQFLYSPLFDSLFTAPIYSTPFYSALHLYLRISSSHHFSRVFFDILFLRIILQVFFLTSKTMTKVTREVKHN